MARSVGVEWVNMATSLLQVGFDLSDKGDVAGVGGRGRWWLQWILFIFNI